MKRIVKIGRTLSIVLFVSGVLFYLLFSFAHPLLHNHHVDGKDHHDCSACNFVAIASFATVPYMLVILVFILFVSYLLSRGFQQDYKKLFDKSRFVRGPPIVSF